MQCNDVNLPLQNCVQIHNNYTDLDEELRIRTAEQSVSQHPEIVMSARKETMTFRKVQNETKTLTVECMQQRRVRYFGHITR